jgi:molecular chaperone DnaJ
MVLKDYYEILEILPGASPAQIKKAYRKLAMRFHPDKNIGNPYVIRHFHEIQEAYEVLSNPVRRNEYHQKRWQDPELNMLFRSNYEVTPELLLLNALKTEKFVQGLDVFRMNYDALNAQLEQLLNDNHLNLLLDQQMVDINEKIITAVLNAAKPLPFRYYSTLSGKLIKLAGTGNDMIFTIYKQLQKKRNQYLWDKYKGVLMILIALVICYLIYKIA